MSSTHAAQGLFADTLRDRAAVGRPDHLRAAALPGHLQRLAWSAPAADANADERDTAALVRDAEDGDRGAETPLYVRVAVDLERVASRVPGDSVLSREDLHQEGATRVIEAVRSRTLSDRFGGNVGAFIGRAIREDLREMALANRPGAPAIPPQRRRALRESLTATAHDDGAYNVFAAAMHYQTHHGRGLAEFWSVYSSMFGESVAWDSPAAGGYTAAEVTAEHSSADAFARVEDRDTARRISDRAALTPREREVMDAVTGADGHVHTNEETAERLGLTVRRVEQIRASAVRKLRDVAELLDATVHYGPAAGQPIRSRLGIPLSALDERAMAIVRDHTYSPERAARMLGLSAGDVRVLRGLPRKPARTPKPESGPVKSNFDAPTPIAA